MGSRETRQFSATLADQGVDKNLADRSRGASALPLPMFEAEVEKATGSRTSARSGARLSAS